MARTSRVLKHLLMRLAVFNGNSPEEKGVHSLLFLLVSAHSHGGCTIICLNGAFLNAFVHSVYTCNGS